MDPSDDRPGRVRELEAIREETRFELRLLHERVNALLAAEAFLTIAYTASMGSRGPWVAVVAPVLAALGLLLALLAWPGVQATAGLVTAWTVRLGDVLDQHPAASAPWAVVQDGRERREAVQRRSLLFFRAAPAVFTAVWVVLLAAALHYRT